MKVKTNIRSGFAPGCGCGESKHHGGIDDTDKA
jgi:hypothetical protein